MMRSMYSGVAGLRNHQIRMDVIGNNIANVNTAGYKKSRVVFKESLYQSIRGASSPTDARGGTNPMAVGLGMALSSIDQIHEPAPTTTTNKTTDMAVDGSGYFILKDGGLEYYTRAGNFDFDRQGILCSTSNGYKVQGWMADKGNGYEIDTNREKQDIDISTYATSAPKATENVEFGGNISSELTTVAITNPPSEGEYPDSSNCVITSKEVYDSLGNKQLVYFRFFKHTPEPGADSSWACDISLDANFEDASANNYEAADVDTGGSYNLTNGVVRVYNINFDATGTIIDPDNAKLDTLVIDRSGTGANNIEMKIDFSELTQYNTESDAEVDSQDGYSMGNLKSYSIGVDGKITGVYDNGQKRDLARVAIASFQNPSGLLQKGSNLYQESNNSGDSTVGGPGDRGMGAIMPGSLEMSNVDLSEEFTDMIITQRGFQANSRVITTSDEMLQELVNLKR